MIHQLNYKGNDKVEESIERLQLMQPKEGYFLAFSGGKDSVVVKALMDMAKVKYDAHYSITSVDPPELIQFIKEYYPDVKMERQHYEDGTPITMWNLIPKKKMPPTRIVRYCCEKLKESSGYGRFTVTGVRWAESSRRANNQGVVTVYNPTKELRENENFTQNNAGGLILNNDNDEGRAIVDSCYKQRKTVLNPIIDWTDEEVWEFIHEYDVPYCKLYDEGFKRLGCIGCPMGGAKHQKEEFARYPKIEQAYLRAFDRMLKAREEAGLTDENWKTGEDVMKWWLGE